MRITLRFAVAAASILVAACSSGGGHHPTTKHDMASASKSDMAGSDLKTTSKQDLASEPSGSTKQAHCDEIMPLLCQWAIDCGLYTTGTVTDCESQLAGACCSTTCAQDDSAHDADVQPCKDVLTSGTCPGGTFPPECQPFFSGSP